MPTKTLTILATLAATTVFGTTGDAMTHLAAKPTMGAPEAKVGLD